VHLFVVKRPTQKYSIGVMKMHKRHSRRNKGSSIVETAASLVILLPTVIFIVFMTVEVSYAYMLKSTLSEGAREAARDLSIAYGLDPTIAGDRTKEEAKAYNKIRIQNVINNSAQFENATWKTDTDPPTVSVSVKYLSGQYSLPVFPNPDPLHLGNTFVLAGTATYRLQ
jgi:Flp pilus assembly protein TadG